jgi:hypothetical protein
MRGVSKHEGHHKSAISKPEIGGRLAFETAASPPPQAEGGTEVTSRRRQVPSFRTRAGTLPNKRGGARARAGPSALPRKFLFTMSNSAVFFVPAARCCARVLLFSFHPPHEGRAERRKAQYFCCRAVGRDRPCLLRRGARPAGRARLFGAPPWRFSVGGRASISGISSGFVQRAPRSQVVVPGGRGPEPPGALVTSRGRRTPLPAPPSARLRRRPLR